MRHNTPPTSLASAAPAQQAEALSLGSQDPDQSAVLRAAPRTCFFSGSYAVLGAASSPELRCPLQMSHPRQDPPPSPEPLEELKPSPMPSSPGARANEKSSPTLSPPPRYTESAPVWSSNTTTRILVCSGTSYFSIIFGKNGGIGHSICTGTHRIDFSKASILKFLWSDSNLMLLISPSPQPCRCRYDGGAAAECRKKM
jgi:hypothetical protein